MSDLDDFERLTAALAPWLEELVIVGGWAHRLHHEHPLAQAPAYAPIRTRDADVAFGTTARLKGTIAKALMTRGSTRSSSPHSWGAGRSATVAPTPPKRGLGSSPRNCGTLKSCS